MTLTICTITISKSLKTSVFKCYYGVNKNPKRNLVKNIREVNRVWQKLKNQVDNFKHKLFIYLLCGTKIKIMRIV